MRKISSFIVALVLTFTMAISSVISTTAVAFAAESDIGIEAATIQPRGSVIYYPVSGSSSGYFSGINSANNTTYRGIPAGTYYFDYYYDSQNTAGTIVIESSSQRIEKPLVGDGSAHSTETFTLSGGTYTVMIIASTGSYGIEKYYAYNLILQ